jgi:hypothetical protein
MSVSTELAALPVAARRLLCLIARQAYHGTLSSKNPGVATMPEVHEACGLDVDGMHALLMVLRDSRLIALEGEYPFEEIRLSTSMEELWTECAARGIEMESIVVD